MLDLIGGRAPAERRPPRRRRARRAPVRLERISFAYPSRAGLVLDGIELELRPGDTVALVGPSGSGKRTMAALLLGFAERAAGRLSVGDVDVAACDLRVWRAEVAWVPQRPTLFHRTVVDNVRLGDARVAPPACAQPSSSPARTGSCAGSRRGYATVIGDGGRPLSAGEGRRLALARAFLRDAPLAILDEPTANLDPESAGIVADAIERLSVDRTVLLIAHAPEIAPHGDYVLELRAGRIVEPSRWPCDPDARAAGALTRPPPSATALAWRSRPCRVGFGVALMTSAGYLISRAAEQPPILSLTVTIVAVASSASPGRSRATWTPELARRRPADARGHP